MKASQCYHYFVLRQGFRTVYNSQYLSVFRMQCEMQKGFIIILSAHHVLTGTYDKRIITGLNCSY